MYLPSLVPIKNQSENVLQLQLKKNESSKYKKRNKNKKNISKGKTLKIELAKEKSKKETEVEKNDTQNQKKGVTNMSKVTNIGNNFISNIINAIDTIFCLKNKLKRLESEYSLQILEAFRALCHCIRLSFFGFTLFLILNLLTYYYNSPYLDVILDECKYGVFCLGFLSFMRTPDFLIYVFVQCLLIYCTIIFVYILSLMIKFFINKTETDFIGDSFTFSKYLFTSPTLRINKIEDNINFKQYLYETLHNTRQSYKKKSFVVYIRNTAIIFLNLCLIVGNFTLTLYLNPIMKSYTTTTPTEYTNKYFVMTSFFSFYNNFLSTLQYYLIDYHVNLHPQTIAKFKFWFPFFGKYFSYFILLVIKFNVFLGDRNNFFTVNFNGSFRKETFKCIEDQSAHNLIFFMFMDFFINNFFYFFVSLIKSKEKPYFSVDFFMINFLCKFFILNVVTLSYPGQGMFTVIMFFMEFHLNFFILDSFKSKQFTSYSSSDYQFNSNIIMIVNLIMFIFIDILFQNQKAILGNYDPSLSPANPTREPKAKICEHDTIEKDYFYIFLHVLNDNLQIVIQSIQLYIFIPCVIGTIIVLNYSSQIVSKFYFYMKLLLTTYDENPPPSKLPYFPLLTIKKENLIQDPGNAGEIKNSLADEDLKSYYSFVNYKNTKRKSKSLL